MSVACSLVCGQEGRFFSLGGREERGGCVAGTICLGLFVPSPHGCMRAGRWVMPHTLITDGFRLAHGDFDRRKAPPGGGVLSDLVAEGKTLTRSNKTITASLD